MDKKILRYIGIVGLSLGVAGLPAQAANKQQTCQTACDTQYQPKTGANSVVKYCSSSLSKSTRGIDVEQYVKNWQQKTPSVKRLVWRRSSVCVGNPNVKPR